jgi:hypothetical protein
LAASALGLGALVSVWWGLADSMKFDGHPRPLKVTWPIVGLAFAPFGILAMAAAWPWTNRAGYRVLAVATVLAGFVGILLGINFPRGFDAGSALVLAGTLILQYVIAIVAVLIEFESWWLARSGGKRDCRTETGRAHRKGAPADRPCDSG